MKRTCKFFRKLTDDESLWKILYLKRWDPPRDMSSNAHHVSAADCGSFIALLIFFCVIIYIILQSKKVRRSWKQSYCSHALTDQNWYDGRRRLAQTYHGHTGTVYCLQVRTRIDFHLHRGIFSKYRSRWPDDVDRSLISGNSSLTMRS